MLGKVLVNSYPNFISYIIWFFILYLNIFSSDLIIWKVTQKSICTEGSYPILGYKLNIREMDNKILGVIIPVADILVKAFRVINSERIFLAFAAISMTIMIIARNHFYTETGPGKQILDERMKSDVRKSIKNVLLRRQ